MRRELDFSFITTLDFYAPVLMFAVGFILLVLMVNRAGWAAHVIGSIFVGLVVFFGGTGLILLLNINTIPSNEVGTGVQPGAFSSTLIVAALLGREVALWMGFSIASRGRKVKARNVDARVLYDQEIAAKRAEYEQANAAAAVPAAQATSRRGAEAADRRSGCARSGVAVSALSERGSDSPRIHLTRPGRRASVDRVCALSRTLVVSAGFCGNGKSQAVVMQAGFDRTIV